ncbi:hypothetical protein R84B8_00048 [Treponema sp. R8-4-B8]
MECFIIENGVERKAGLEDILPLLDDRLIQKILREAYEPKYLPYTLPYVLAYMPEKIKNIVYRNLSLRINSKIKERVKKIESDHEEVYGYFENGNTELISFIGKYIMKYGSPDRLVWKQSDPKEKTQANPTEELIKKIENARSSKKLFLPSYKTKEMSKEDMENAFAAFHDRKNELQEIREFTIGAEMLPAAALIFENETLDTLRIDGKFTGTWPEFMKNCGTLTSIKLDVYEGLTEFPAWIRNAVSLRKLYISGSFSKITSIPDWIGDLQSLTEISIDNRDFITLPDSIGNLINLTKLTIKDSAIEKLPDSIGNLHNLTQLSLPGSEIETLPDSIGNMEKLTELHLENCKNLKRLPNSIGKLKNLVKLILYSSTIEILPDTLANCTSLEYVDICDTCFTSLPNFIYSVKTLKQSIKILNQPINPLPIKRSISYLSFCNYYYTLIETIFRFREKARREGLLALENELEDLSKGFFKTGIRLVVYGTDAAVVRELLTLKIEREHDHYIKTLKKIAMEGIISIQDEDDLPQIGIRLASMVDIKNNPLDAACAKYLAGDLKAFDDINFKASLQPEQEREEKRFIRRALQINEMIRRDGWLEVEKHLDNDGIAAKDVFEYGLQMLVDNWDLNDIDKYLNPLTDRETDPARKNLALAKKHAIRILHEGNNLWIFLFMLAYFDDEFEQECLSEFGKEYGYPGYEDDTSCDLTEDDFLEEGEEESDGEE